MDTTFPENWDANRTLRHRNGEVLLWAHYNRGMANERRVCLVLVTGEDSSGNTDYYLSEMYSDTKPFNKWNYGFIHYSDYFKDTVTGFSFGFHDVHLEVFHHKPTQAELMALLRKWEFCLYERNYKTILAGINSRLWLKRFGFVPDLNQLL